MKKPIFYLLLFVFLGFSSCKSAKNPTQLKSPNGNIALEFSLDSIGAPHYQISYQGKELVSPSLLGFLADRNFNLADNFDLKSSHLETYYDEWDAPWGENKHHINHYNELNVKLENKEGTHLTLVFRLFNEGAAFRYEYNIAKTDSVTIMDELTQFNFLNPATTWTIPADFESYEHLYRKLPLDELKAANTPATFNFENLAYTMIHEAALVDFPEMTIQSYEPRKFKANLAPMPNGTKALVPNTFHTPWRTMHIVDKATDLIASSMILNLNDPCVLEDTSWIKPMKYVGIWWGMHLGIQSWSIHDRHGATTKNAIELIDFAAKNNIDAVLFEGWNEGWDTWGTNQEFNYLKAYDDFDIEQIAQYAKEKGIKIIGHHETGGNIPHYESQLDSALNWLTSLGIYDLKTGYAGGFKEGYRHHSQYGVQHYRKVVEKTAAHKITLNAHEPIKDTGIRRTYPNSMTREGARGMEWNAWSEGNPPEHHEILPFTRIAAGPMDYTPGIFDILYKNTKNLPERKAWNGLDKGNSRVNTTLAKQVALWVVLYSPMQMASDLPSNYEGHPAFQFFRDFDPDFDKTYPLEGEIGEYVVIARKAKENYFLGAVTNEEERDLTIDLDFLKPKTTYQAIIYADGKDADWTTNPESYEIIKKDVTSADTLNLHLAKGGGTAISFKPIN